MRKFLIIGVFAITAIPALGATRCIKLNGNTTCDAPTSTKSEWGMTCAPAIKVQGVMFCSNQSAPSAGTPAETLTVSPAAYASQNQYCYCKMVAPAVSRWIYVATFSTYDDCYTNCAAKCADRAVDYISVRNTMFSVLSN